MSNTLDEFPDDSLSVPIWFQTVWKCCNYITKVINSKEKVTQMIYSLNIACEPGSFGINCSSECHCQVNVTCNHVFGSCKNNACASGYEGKNCSVRK